MNEAPRGLLLAIGIVHTNAEELQAQGIDVHELGRTATVEDMAAASLELRKRHPRARLLVAGPERLVREFERRYPPLLDAALTSTSPAAVLAALPPEPSSL